MGSLLENSGLWMANGCRHLISMNSGQNLKLEYTSAGESTFYAHATNDSMRGEAMTNKELKAIFGGDRDSPAWKMFQKDWRPEVGHEVIWKDTKLIISNNHDRGLLKSKTKEGKFVCCCYKDEITYIPSITALQEMSGLDWWIFNDECKRKTRDYYCETCGGTQAVKDYHEAQKYNRYFFCCRKDTVDWLLAAAMVIAGDGKGFKWNGERWVKE